MFSKWYYVTGAVWTTPAGPDDGGECVAMRASNSNILPTERDKNLRLCSAAPEMAEILLSSYTHVSHGGPTLADVKAVLVKAGILQEG